LVYVRSYLALLLATVWAALMVAVVLARPGAVGLMQIVSPPLFVLVGALVGVDLRRVVKRNGGGDHA
jgi:hypothetical protein